MNKIATLILFLLLSLYGTAQVTDFDLLRGPETKDNYKLTSRFLTYDSSGNTYMLYHPGYGTYFHLQKYNSDMQPVVERKMDFWIDRKMRDLQTLINFHDTLYLFTTSTNVWLTTNRLTVQTIDPITLEQGEPRLLLEIENFKSQYSTFSFTLSADRSKLMVCNYTDVPLKKMARLNISVFDRGLHKLWQSERILDGIGRLAYLMQTEVDNNGNAFLLMSLYRHSIWNMRAELRNQLGVLSFTQGGRQFAVHRVDFPDLYVRDTRIVPTQNGKVFCAGLYSPSMVDGFVKGRYSTIIEPSEEALQNTILEEFDAFDIQGLMSDKAIESGRELFNYHIDTLLLRPDKGVLMVVEQEYVDYERTTAPTQSRSARMRAEYYGLQPEQGKTVQHKKYNDILLIKLAANGTTEWVKTVYKRQKADDDGIYCSIAVYAPEGKNSCYLFFNKYRRNPKHEAKEADNKRAFDFFPRCFSTTEVVKVIDNGQVMSDVLFHTDRHRCLPVPKSTIDPRNGSFIFWGKNQNRYNLIKLSLSDM